MSGKLTHNGDGNRVKSVADGGITYYIGNYYEWRVETSGTTGVKYYYAGSQRVGTTLLYLFGDHLAPFGCASREAPRSRRTRAGV